MMTTKPETRPNRARLMMGAAAVAMALGALAPPARAADPAPSGAADADAPMTEIDVVAKVMRVSPSNVPLEATEPTSIVPEGFLRDNIVPLSSFDDMVKFQPSVYAQSPNGPGLGKAETLSLRGFQDSQFNITFDGIPFGDATDLHHTSSALFVAHDMGQAEVDRGPGTASTIGKATFGGTLGFLSKTPSEDPGVTAYGTYGSWNTKGIGGEVDTGRTVLGRMFFDVQRTTSDGYLTGAEEQRTNYFFKDVLDIGERTTVTLVASKNHSFEYTTQGVTLADLAKYGDNWGLGDNPKAQSYYKYQPSRYTSDFDYIRVQSELTDSLKLDNTAYTNGFGHHYKESSDASDSNPKDVGVTVYNAAGKKVATYAGDIPGKEANANYRTFGDTLRLTDSLSIGDIKAGVWYDRQLDHRHSESYDWTQNILVTGKYGTPYTYKYRDLNTTWQPYAEFDWKVTPDLTLIPGVKVTSFTRDVDALYNKTKPPAPLNYSETYTEAQPSIAAHYTIQEGWTAYAQVAKGFLAPPIDVFQVAKIASIKPEETMNYQIGTAVQHGRWMVGADAYYIDFSNYISTSQVPGTTESTFVNGAGAIYKGLEMEAQYALTDALSLYANASLNHAQYKDNYVWVANTPQWMATTGVMYDSPEGLYFSAIGKVVGPFYGQDNTTDAKTGQPDFANAYRIHPVFTADVSVGWRLKDLGYHLVDVTPSLKIGNLFDTHRINGFAGSQSATGDALYWTTPGRSVFFNLSVTGW
ncbi:TonB-dependent receptor [Nitrospirillum amazonense]|uniref:TonB-dependent receptor n=1 Tax=Nitrospirillum amazonense TaxID=28077 RepID=UPI002DD43BFD|nr:TonB-dependent receptor [Nitrospirillum amazonense]MEC4595123.1 TonB-dependent receptor [Nitrospirillum amazonense]